MHKHVGLLYLSTESRKLLLILKNQKWTIPTFSVTNNVVDDSQSTQLEYSTGKILPIELYTSKDSGFEYGTFVCLVEKEFTHVPVNTYCWADFMDLPKNLHVGLRTTLTDNLVRTKLDTILELHNAIII